MGHQKLKYIVLCLIVFLQIQVIFPQAYKISLTIKGASGKQAQFAYYQGDRQYLVKSGVFDKNDKLEFSGNEILPTGIYFISISDVGFFDLLIKTEQEFSVHASLNNLSQSITIRGSKENENFYNYQKSVHKHKERINFIDSALVNNPSQDIKNKLENEKKGLNEQLIALVSEYKNTYKNTYLSKILIAMEATEPSEIDYSDPELLRTPFYHNMIRYFIKKNINSNIRYIISETGKFLTLIRKTETNFQYAATYLLNFYNTFYKNGINEVFVFIADNYFLPNKVSWLSNESLQQLKERRDFLAQGLPGMQAADLTLESPNGEYLSLLQVNARLTLLYFWSLNCGHCTASTNVLIGNYQKLSKKGVQVFAVNIDKDKEAWKKKLEEMDLPWINCIDPQEESAYRDKYYVYGSPILFILDKEKKIIAIAHGESEIEEYTKKIIESQ
jgi:peroxiredoxin